MPDFTTPAAFTISAYSTSDEERQVVFVVPVHSGAGSRAWKSLAVKPIPSYTAARLTVGMVASVAALHMGFVGIPAAAVPHLALPTYTVHWVVPGTIILGEELSLEELQLPLAESLATEGVWIVASSRRASEFTPPRLRGWLSKTLSEHDKYLVDGPRNSKAFRERVSYKDDAQCVITGDVESVQAAHIIDRYIGSSILASVLGELHNLRRQYRECVPPSILHELRYGHLQYCDIRISTSPGRTLVDSPLIDEPFNGETLSASAHVSKDLYSAFAIHPPTGLVLWFNLASAQNLVALTSCGGLADSTANPPDPDSRLYEKREGILPDTAAHVTTHFTIHSLALYLLMCQKFLPERRKSEIIQLVAGAATELDEGGGGGGGSSDQQSQDVARAPIDEEALHLSYSEGSPAHLVRWTCEFLLCLAAGSFAALAAWVARANDEPAAVPASTSSTSNTSSTATFLTRPPHLNIFREVKDALRFVASREADEDDDKATVRARVLALFPHLTPHDLTAKQLEVYHQNVVFKAILLLRLTAALRARHTV